jgi:hypothetical protein
VKVIRVSTDMTMENVGNVGGMLGKYDVPESHPVGNSTKNCACLCLVLAASCRITNLRERRCKNYNYNVLFCVSGAEKRERENDSKWPSHEIVLPLKGILHPDSKIQNVEFPNVAVYMPTDTTQKVNSINYLKV